MRRREEARIGPRPGGVATRINGVPPEGDAVAVGVLAEQFAAHYAGADPEFGLTHVRLAGASSKSEVGSRGCRVHHIWAMSATTVMAETATMDQTVTRPTGVSVCMMNKTSG